MYCAYVTKIRNLRKHTNADRLLCGECFGNTVIVDLGTDPDQLGVYFPVDGKLGVEFAQKNDLLRRKDENGNPAGGYLDPEKRNIKALKLRGEKSDGLFLPISCMKGFIDPASLGAVYARSLIRFLRFSWSTPTRSSWLITYLLSALGIWWKSR